MLIDDFTDCGLISKLGTHWRGVSDKVMGGISEVKIFQSVVHGVHSLRLTGDVCLENNGGFIQAVLDLSHSGDAIDVSNFTGLRLLVCGPIQEYAVHLRTTDNVRSWQSYRSSFKVEPDWKTVDLPFCIFRPHRLKTPLDETRLRRIGLVAIGSAISVDLAVSRLELYR